MQLIDPFGWHILDAEGLRGIRERLSSFESMTWNEILVTSRKQNHRIPFKDIVPNARKQLEALRLSDTDDLVSFATER